MTAINQLNKILVIKRRNRKKRIRIITNLSKLDRQRADGGPLAVSISGMPPAGRNTMLTGVQSPGGGGTWIFSYICRLWSFFGFKF